jgi:cell wall-associated NlpC family hydrolase
MQDGYYDCSSYVWRSFAAAGLYLQSKNYAPTAADLGKWCNDKGYVILSGTVNIQKLLPGDLIFWIGTEDNGHVNGRYRNIYHVEMYQGMNLAITVNSQAYYGDTSYDIIVARPWDTSASGLKVTTYGKKQLKLTWSTEFGADGYQIYRSTSKNGTYKKIATVKNAKSYIDKISNSKKKYYYKVRAYWKSSEKTCYSKFSNIASK